MSTSMYIDARAVFVPTESEGEGPVRQRCVGCGEITVTPHSVLDCLQILREKMQRSWSPNLPFRQWEPSRQ